MGLNAAPGWMPGPRHYEEVELWIKGTFLEALFEPLMKALRSAWTRNRLRFQNSAIDEEALLRAIERGDIVLTKNRIKGKMSSVIVRGLRAFGAKRYGETWEFKNVPEEVLLASSNYRKLKIQAAELARKAMDAALDFITIESNKSEGVNKAVIKASSDFDKHAENRIGIKFPDISDSGKEDIKSGYKRNIGRYIRGMGKSAIEDLRNDIEDWVINDGMRTEEIAKKIKSRLGETNRRAEFLARQETNLFLAAYEKARYLDVGIDRYIWITRDDSSVRPEHKLLHGRVFKFENPPIASTSGDRNNPGESFGCRCIASPILETEMTAKIKTGDKAPRQWIK